MYSPEQSLRSVWILLLIGFLLGTCAVCEPVFAQEQGTQTAGKEKEKKVGGPLRPADRPQPPPTPE